MLLPEIALTGQFLDRFAARFGARPAEWHSGLTERQRERVWTAAASGEARAIVGARSALFLPFADLGLIVVDEEHEGAYKQEEGVIYNARDMAVVRARFETAPIVLASATPAIETRFNATVPDAIAGSSSPPASGRRGCPTSRRSISSAKVPRAAGGSRRAPSPRSRRRGAGASRRCCF